MQGVLQEFDPLTGSPIRLSFRIPVKGVMIAFTLPANIDAIDRLLKQDRRVPKSMRTRMQATRVAWRILKDWVASQMAIIEAGMVEISEVFLPYMQTANGETVGERFRKAGPLALGFTPEGKGDGDGVN